MSDTPPDEPTSRIRPRFSKARQPRAQGAGQQLLAQGLRALDSKGGATTNRALQLARGSFAPSPRAALRRALSKATGGGRAGDAKHSRYGRGQGVRAAGKHAQRVIVKARVVPLRNNMKPKAMREHLTYMARDAAALDGKTGQLFDGAGELDQAAVDAFAERSLSGRHQFRFIVSPERGGDLDMPRFTRDLVRAMERDLGTRLDYAAAVHHDTDQPHVHLVVNGHNARGGDLVISRDYIAQGMRHRAMELATDVLGYRSALDILQSLARDVQADRFTALDRRLQAIAERHPEGVIDLRSIPADPHASLQRRLHLGRLAYLTDHDLAENVGQGVWRLQPDALDRLRGLTQHREIQHIAERHLEPGDRTGSIEVIDKATQTVAISGRVLGRGIANELSGTPYLIVAGIDGKNYYAALSTYSERDLAQVARAGDIVTVRRVDARATGRADRLIVDLANRNEGVYDPKQHLAQCRGQRLPFDTTAERYVDAHVRRLDALVSRRLVTPEPDGRYRVPADLIARLEFTSAPARDAAVLKVEVHGRDLRAQTVARAMTWLDEQLISGVPQQLRQVAVRTRFQDELVDAADQRARRLVQLGLAHIDGDRIQLDAQLKPKLARLERSDAATRLTRQFGRYVDLDETRRFSGHVAAIETLASGPHAVVVSGDRFTLVSAERELANLVGKDVSLSLAQSRGRDAEQTRVRFRVLDALDRSPSLGR
jgi:type IV secretory pathway VirD2 relaxase